MEFESIFIELDAISRSLTSSQRQFIHDFISDPANIQSFHDSYRTLKNQRHKSPRMDEYIEEIHQFVVDRLASVDRPRLNFSMGGDGDRSNIWMFSKIFALVAIAIAISGFASGFPIELWKNYSECRASYSHKLSSMDCLIGELPKTYVKTVANVGERTIWTILFVFCFMLYILRPLPNPVTNNITNNYNNAPSTYDQHVNTQPKEVVAVEQPKEVPLLKGTGKNNTKIKIGTRSNELNRLK